MDLLQFLLVETRQDVLLQKEKSTGKTRYVLLEEVYATGGQGRLAGFVVARDMQHFLLQISKHMPSALQNAYAPFPN